MYFQPGYGSMAYVPLISRLLGQLPKMQNLDYAPSRTFLLLYTIKMFWKWHWGK